MAARDSVRARVRGTKVTTIAKTAGIYFDQLAKDFETTTGLRTRLT